jgi:GT2 family glycosyltransferase/glycosyltransferase involved in cell wall biosynthesis/SAM-dependent methyltransferase
VPESEPTMSTDTETQVLVNSQEYWERRFSTDWDALGGRQQSRSFMDLLVKYLPAPVAEEIEAGALSILDCGCALGDGTAVLAAEFPRSQVSGFDFSASAVETARKAHPGIDFFVSDFEALERSADVLIVSHCLEHLSRPVFALRHLAARSRRYLLVLVPYLESYPPHHEHRRVVHAGTFPEEVDGWRVADRMVLPPTATWEGNQLLLVYRPAEAGEVVAPAPLPSIIDVDHQMRLRSLEAATASFAAGLQRIAGELESRQVEELRELRDKSREEREELRELRDKFREEREELREELQRARHRTQEIADERDRSMALVWEQVEQANRALADRDERIRAMEEEIQKGCGFVLAVQEERRKTVRELNERVAATEREREDLRVEVESWRWDATAARRELSALQGSRLWRIANVYWKVRRKLFGKASRPAAPRGEAASLSAPGAAAPERIASRLDDPAIPPGLPRVPSTRYDVVVFSIIDWDFRFQRPQQIATQLGRHGHRVFYLSTTSTIPADGPAWTMAWKAKNVVEVKLRSRRPLDIYGGRLEEEDLATLEGAFSELLTDLSLGDVVSLVQIPFWAPLADRLRERYGWRVVYDCMDEWTNFPGFGEAVLSLEEGLVRDADVTVATARLLFEKLDGRASRLVLAQNGVDLDHYKRYYGENALLGPVTHPVIGYYGALASWVDVDLLEKIARRFPKASIVLAGGVFDVDLSRVAALPNVRLLGQRPYEEMPQLLWHFDACVIPFLVNDITEATNPVKFYEYLSAGKPVVSPRLTELLPFEELCYLADDHDGFLAGLAHALAEPADDPRRERRKKVAEENDWRERYEVIHHAVTETFPLVSVVVVTYGGLPLTRRCLDSLLEAETWPRFEVLVVDNASPDGTPEYLRAVAAGDTRVRVYFQSENLGFPAANNVGIAQARGEVIVLLNNDTVVPPGMIGRLVRTLEKDRRIGIVCATTNFCGNEARVEPDYEDLADMPRYAASRARKFAGRLLDLQVAAMYCVAARREVVREIGPLDEAFGIGMFEDDDYSVRMREAGYRVVCAEDTYVHHVGQGSFQTLSPQEYESLWSRNQAHYEKKWGRKWKPHTLRSGVAPVMSKVGLA